MTLGLTKGHVMTFVITVIAVVVSVILVIPNLPKKSS